MFGGEGADHMAGGMHDDRLIGGPGNDRLFGVEYRDYLQGDDGIDVCLDWEIDAVTCETSVRGH
jgi:Ca2+-binding RTX toxin-like protein